MLAQHSFGTVNHMYNDSGKRLYIDILLHEADGKNKWIHVLSNEWDRLAQGDHIGVGSTDTIEFINHFSVSTDRKVTYASYLCDHRPLKDEG